MKIPARGANRSPVCAITCFEQEKVARLKTTLAKEMPLLPQHAEMYKLLGNVTRLKILRMLEQGELCVCDVAHVLGLTVAATSHQLKLLRDHGWLTMRNDGKMVYYRLQGERLLTALKDEWHALEKRLA
ncbi:MAG: metalloregulator ArsR/SmtB family transcription factor [Betaproteobacteria bacterium]|nr:metalloregulator ArsR/SmtB family transcription factor [Betaproteobacteria bacterium]